ncbi:MAG: twin-arginine translocase subunit TatC [Deltaproteobacteria bacterium]|nr:twin-arginine translocase subunit TatC [Deltaproteobacteria bacterium]
MSEERLPFLSHLEELRKRLIRCFIVVGVLFFALYPLSSTIFEWLTSPLRQVLPEGQTLIFTGIVEGFLTHFKVGFYTAFLIAIPYLLFEIWRFVVPGLYDQEKKYAILFVGSTLILFTTGALFGFFVILPVVLPFFINDFSSEWIRPLPSIQQYLSFTILMMLASGLSFELPVFLVLLNKVGVISRETLVKKRGYAIIIIAIVAAIITPPDVISMMCIMIPMILLYELSVLIMRFLR